MRTDEMEVKTESCKRSGGHFRAAMLAVLMLFVVAAFAVPQKAEAHFGQYGGNRCTNCHTPEAGGTFWVAVDGVEETGAGDMAVTAAPGQTLEIDYYFTGVRGASDNDVGVEVLTPANTWTVSQGTDNAPVLPAWDLTWNLANAQNGGVITPFNAPDDHGFTVNWDATPYDSGISNVAMDTNAEPDGIADMHGMDFRVTVDPAAADGPYSIVLYGVGHTGNPRTSKSITLTVNVVSAGDSTAPDVVADLAAGAVTATTIALTWTAPGDDGAVGTAATYDIRYSTAGTINDGNWASATLATGEPAPSLAGTTENFTLTGLNPSQQYWFAIRTSDEVPNTALTSNSPTATTSAVCAPAPPSVSIAPGTQAIPNDGGLVVYTVTITNNDSATCGPTTFTLSTDDTNGTEFYTSTLDKADTGALASNGASTTASLTVQALPGFDGVSNDTTVTVTDSPTHDPPVPSTAVTTNVTLGGGCVGSGSNPNASAGGTFITGR